MFIIQLSNNVNIEQTIQDQENMMKTFNIAAILSSLALLAAGAAYAEDSVKHNFQSHQFMSKRPYQKTIVNKSSGQDGQWEGATYIEEQELKSESHLKSQQAFRLHNLGKRTF